MLKTSSDYGFDYMQIKLAFVQSIKGGVKDSHNSYLQHHFSSIEISSFIAFKIKVTFRN